MVNIVIGMYILMAFMEKEEMDESVPAVGRFATSLKAKEQ